MDPIKSIGSLLVGNEQRDAIHIAVLPVTLAEDMRPGEYAGLVYGTTDQVKGMDPAYDLKPIGIIDPFLGGDNFNLRCRIKQGSRVWLFLLPNSITGLRHHWTHPGVDNRPVPSSDHEDWLRRFAERWNLVYNDLILSATAATKGEFDRYVVAHGIDLHSPEDLGPDHDLFWMHLEALTGRTYDEGHRSRFGWSCSC